MLLLGRVSALLSVVVSVVWWLVLVCACAYQQEFDNKTYLEDIPKLSCWIFCMVFCRPGRWARALSLLLRAARCADVGVGRWRSLAG